MDFRLIHFIIILCDVLEKDKHWCKIVLMNESPNENLTEKFLEAAKRLQSEEEILAKYEKKGMGEAVNDQQGEVGAANHALMEIEKSMGKDEAIDLNKQFQAKERELQNFKDNKLNEKKEK